MPRLTNVKTGARVQVRDEKVVLMGSDWEPTKDAPKAPAKKSAAKPSSK